MCIALTFFAIGNGMILHSDLSLRRIKKARSIANGCTSYTSLYSTMPLTRKTVQKTSFRSYMIWTVLPIVAFNIILNILAMIVDGFQPIMGSVGLASLISLAAMIILYICFFGVYKRTEKTERIKTALYWVLYFVFIGVTVFGLLIEWCNEVVFLMALAGIPAIVLAVAAALFILLREKLVYEKKLTFAAWFD